MTIDGIINVLLIEDEEFDVKRVKNTIELFKEKIFIREVFSNGTDALKLLKAKPNYFSIFFIKYI